MFQGLPECLSSEKAQRREEGPCEVQGDPPPREEWRGSGWGWEVSGTREVKGQPFNESEEAI